ncbi:Transcriptional regulatory protein sin3, partial [Coemansia sp. RSA 485]
MPTSQHMQSPPPNHAPSAIQSIQNASAQTAAGSAMSLQGGSYSSATVSSMGPAHVPARSPSAVGSPTMSSGQRPRQVPLEFNHAINYVNKIKMRFAAEPDRYKEFLEILQTYQKESRPIQEVYAQVQVLFSSAPDLLDEFKQFLPDTSESAGSSAGAGAASAGIGSPTTGYVRSSSSVPQGQQLSGGNPQTQMGMSSVEPLSAGSRLPPVGNFTPVNATDPYATAPVSAGSTTGSMPSVPASAAIPGAASNQGGSGASYDNKGMAATPTSGRKRRGVMSGNSQASGAPGSSKRRTKGAKTDGSLSSGMMTDPQLQMQMQMQMQQAAAGMGYGQHIVSQTMVQQPINPATATPDELAFFERVKRFIGQPSAYNEFLKLLNLYNQQVLDPKTLVERAESFIGDDQELFGWFKQFVGFDEQQQLMEDNRSSDEAIIDSILGPEPGPYMPPEEVAKTLRPARPKVQLSQCKAYGPSYRLLPESSAQAKCSGRDAMCYEVLNDRWASHPTWASEDTDFVHHKKNVYEEAMFRSEEDRHEMDIEIDTNLSVIRQLTPIAQQIEQMDPEKQMQLTLPENFWGMSEALPRRALRKVYDSNRALEIIKAMHTHPAVAIPIVLKRLKQKDEEWRRQRREFAKVWREIDAKNYYRALDHQGLTFKSADRKTISPKHLITEIETRRREQQNLTEDGGARSQSRKVASALRHRYQLEYQFSEPTVIADVVNAILAHVGRQNSQFAPSEKEMMEKFFHELFGGLLGIESPTAPPLINGDIDSSSQVAAQAANGEGSNNNAVMADSKSTEEPAKESKDAGNTPNGITATSPAPKANGTGSAVEPDIDAAN